MAFSRSFIFLMILGICSPAVVAQIEFEPGYYISNSGNRMEGLIKNQGWKKNPVVFQFKTNELATPQNIGILDASEFEITGHLKYVRAAVPVDQSTDSRTQLSISMVPEFEPDTVFLNVLVEGEATLFEMENEVNKRYYFQLKGEEITPLEFKKFLISSTEIRSQKTNTKIRTNKTYQQQIRNSLNCSNINQDEIEKLEYKKRELVAVFTQFNECVNSDFIVYRGKKAKRFNISIGPRFYRSTLEVTGSAERDFADFGSQSALTFDIEAEAFLPFNNNQWSLIVGFTPQKFAQTVTTEHGTISFDHASLNVPVGVRFNKYINPKTRWYLQSAFILTMFSETDIQYDFRNGANDTVSKPGISFAAGFIYKDLINAQFEFEPRRQLFALATTFETAYQTAALSVSYRLPF